MRVFKFFHACILLFVILSSTGLSQIHWIEYQGNPVITTGPFGSWDYHWIAVGSVVKQDSQYAMWYSGAPPSGDQPQSGRATSIDGITWQKDTLNPVLKVGPLGAWDDDAAFVPNVLVDSSGYKMWYAGWKGQQYGYTQIGLAKSIDGISWQKDSLNPVLSFGQSSDWDASYLDPDAVLFDGSIYKMWYMGGKGGGFPTTSAAIGFATSIDGIHWTKYPQNPVLGSGSSGSWDAGGIGLMEVIQDEGHYLMWYTGKVINFHLETMQGIGFAVSADGIHWKKYPGNPVIPQRSFWNSSSPYYPKVIREGDEYKMWYGRGYVIGFATSQRSPATIAVSDTSKDFQSVVPGDVSDTLHLLIDNWGFTNLVINSVENHGSQFAILNAPSLPDSIKPFDDITIDVIFQPVQEGTFDDTIFVSSNDVLYPLKKVTLHGQSSITGVGESISEQPLKFELQQNYPNPFNPSTTIKYQIPTAGLVSLKVYDVLGNEVATLVNEDKGAGSYKVEYNASVLSSGIYFYRMHAGSFTQARKMILLK